ncbi:PREDICTED: L-lactate dehydrogenase B chain [Papilio polytes]|uniref:L-lactate dehydrogenase B chain n=1 Tax=Papilio polytes TaxID=76194 RepID=UPI00067618A3|nr:PREDICTED: L-lactate dehydrogenase B chain [Papilio polytes]
MSDNSENNWFTNGKMATVERLLHPLHQKADDTGSKVTVVGAGQVGMAAVFSMLTQGVTNNIALVDVVQDKLRGEMMDLQHGCINWNSER